MGGEMQVVMSKRHQCPMQSLGSLGLVNLGTVYILFSWLERTSHIKYRWGSSLSLETDSCSPIPTGSFLVKWGGDER